MKKTALAVLVGCLVLLTCINNPNPVKAQRSPRVRVQQQVVSDTDTFFVTSTLLPDGQGGFAAGPRTSGRLVGPPETLGPDTVSFTSPSLTAAGTTFNISYDDPSITANVPAGDIANMKAAVAATVLQFTSKFNDSVNINIKVAANTTGLGQSTTSLRTTGGVSPGYTSLRTAMTTDQKSADDTAALAGSVPAVDPVAGAHDYIVSFAQSKAIGTHADDAVTLDGTFTFNGTVAYTYDPNNRVVAGKTDFIGVAMHEFSEIMGRIALMGQNLTGNPDYMEMDLFHYTGAGTRGLNNGPGRSFSIDNGTTLLKAFNNQVANPGSDLQDWASGTNDSFNAFSSPGVKNDMTAVDLRVMDALGYDRSILSAADVAISGRVVSASGSGIRNARVTLVDSRGHTLTALTNASGYYSFKAVPSGDTYIAQPSARGYAFGPRVMTVNDSFSDLTFIAQ